MAAENRDWIEGDFSGAIALRAARLARMETDPGPPYRIAVYRAKGCYFALTLDLPGCIARGETEVEAIENARGSIRTFLAISRVLAERAASVELEVRP
jgi:predicted RNase H-like HicB family nuclease